MPSRKKRKGCPSCGASFQRGVYVWRLLPDGAKRQRVCKTCAGLAVPILASDAPARCLQCSSELASFCAGCVGAVMEQATGRKISVRALATQKRKVRK